MTFSESVVIYLAGTNYHVLTNRGKDMINMKKSKKEKAATRHAQNQRAAQRKKALGLKRISLWMPAEALDKAGNLDRIGIVLAEEGADQTPCVLVRKQSGKLEIVPWQGRLI